MIRIVLLIFILLIAFWGLRWFLKTPASEVAKTIKKSGLYILAVLFVLLALTGKLNWIFALVSVLLAYAGRMLPVILRYAPQLQRLWVLFNSRKASADKNSSTRPPSSDMTKAQAYDVLGLKPGATEQEIIQAHKRLMQKNHPDRGGSDFLAAQINRAKQVLLNRP